MPRRILLITAGETPQLVTETVYGLLTREPEPWVPDEILIATTASGAKLFEQGGGRNDLAPLLGAGGRLRQLYQELGRSGEAVEPALILACSEGGSVCRDIRSDVEVSAFAQTLLDRMQAITSDDDSELHLSIAGGRKTMSFIAGQVMALCGRRDDTLSHCLVEPQEWETNSAFWWPGNDGNAATLAAAVNLHEVPFLRLRAHLDVRQVFAGEEGWIEAIRKANNALADNELTVDFLKASVRVGDEEIQLNLNMNFAVYALIAVAQLLGEPLEWVGKPHLEWRLSQSAERFQRTYAKCFCVANLDSIYEGDASWVAINRNRLDDAIKGYLNKKSGFSYEGKFGSPKSRLPRLFRTRLAPRLAEKMILGGGKRPVTTGFKNRDIKLVLPDSIDLDFFREP